LTSFGDCATAFCLSLICEPRELPLLLPKKFCSASLIPFEPEPTPSRTKLNTKTSASST
jgi:hypothetical protein